MKSQKICILSDLLNFDSLNSRPRTAAAVYPFPQCGCGCSCCCGLFQYRSENIEYFCTCQNFAENHKNSYITFKKSFTTSLLIFQHYVKEKSIQYIFQKFSLSQSILWFTVSNAFSRSTKIPHTYLPESTRSLILSVMLIIA